MKESTKNIIKLIGSVSGAVGGSCAASVIIGAIAAVNPIAGATGFIGKIVISSVIAERCSEYIMDKTDIIIETSEAFKNAVNDVKEKLNNENVEEESEEA